MERRRRIGAYGVCRDDAGRVLLVRASARSARPGTWFLPGGGIHHGEHPADAVRREVAEETGLRVEVAGLRDIAAEVVARPPALEHTDGVVYDVSVAGGGLRPELDGTSDQARWVLPGEVAELPLSGLAARALGQPEARPVAWPVGVPAPRTPSPSAGGQALARPARGQAPARPARGQRFAAYGLVTDPAGRVLLTRNAEGYPGAGRWHLPGGGTDFGEQPADGLLREITEETDQSGQVTRLLVVTHRRNRRAVGPDGAPVDWHGVRAVFRVQVADPTPARVRDVGGSTSDAAWFDPDEVGSLPLTDIAADMLRRDGWRAERAATG